jgi:capsular polysaccharide biosynthesis protein
MDNFFNNTNLMQILLKWKWHLIIITIIAALVSLVVSSPFFMKPRFKSVAYIYPSNILPYSEESQTEQMLQWMNSSDVRDSVIKKFDLAKHYKILASDPHYASTMEGFYNKNVSISKTQYESVEVVVTDIDPVMARDMVNSILSYTDIKIRATHYVNYKRVLDAIERRLNSKLAEMDSVKNKYREIATTYGLYDIGGQSREITRGDLGTVDGAGNNIKSKDVQRLKQGMIEKSGELMYLSNRISYSAAEFSEIEKQYEGAKYEIDKQVTFVNVVTPPVVADKKSYPKRLFVLFYFVAGTLFFSLLAIAFLERNKVSSSESNN